MPLELMKRKHLESQNNKGKKHFPKKTNLFDDGSEFGNLVVKSGALLQLEFAGVLLDRDQISFRQQLVKSLKLHLDYPLIIDDSLKSISQLIEDAAILKLLFNPVLLKNDEEPTTFGIIGINDSFLKILMSINDLQTKLMSILLDRIVLLNIEEKNRKENESLCHSVIKQFCWLDFIVQPQELLSKLFETIKACSGPIQEEIILSLPQIVEDIQHQHVARCLIDLMSSEPHLILTIIDSLDNLNLPHDCLQQLKESVTNVLSSSEIEKLPVVLKFLFQHVTNDDALLVVLEVRKNVKLESELSALSTSTPKRKVIRRKEASKGTFALIIETLKSGVQFHKSVCAAWMKALEGTKDCEEIKTIDIFVIFILHSLDDHKKIIEIILRNKIISSIITLDTFSQVFSSRPEILEEYFKSIMQMGEVFMRSSHQVVIKFACSLYKLAFSSFTSYCQQEIVGKLVTHIGSGCRSEIDLTLNILLDLVQGQLDRMIPYSGFINGVLDYLDNLDLMQIGKLYQVLGRLAFCSRHGSVTQDGLHIVVRKQLSSPTLRYQQIGVVGGVMMIMSLAGNDTDHDRSRIVSSPCQTSTQNFKSIKDMFQLIQSSISKSPHSSALFFEELATLVKQKCLDKDIEKWISEKILSDFQVDFVADISNDNVTNESSRKPGEIVWSFQYALDSLAAGEEGIAINLAPLVTYQPIKNFDGHLCNQSKLSVWCLSSSFRLLHVCQGNMNDGNMDGITALLGCAIKFPKSFPLNSVLLQAMVDVKEKTNHLHCAFLLVNWLRELLNAFSGQSDFEIQTNVVKRLQILVCMQNLIEKMLLEMPDYVPPPCNFHATFDDDHKDVSLIVLPKKGKVVTNTAAIKKKETTKKLSRRKRKRDEVDRDDDTFRNKSLDETTTIITQPSKSNKNNITINRAVLSTYFRELDMEVFKILKYTKLNSSKLEGDHSSELEQIKLTLEPCKLEFLLDDLLKKLNHSLTKDSDKRNIFLKVKNEKAVGFRNLDLIGCQEVGKQVCDLLPHMCRYLESLNMYFQVTSDKADETHDDESCFDLDENQSMSQTLSLSLQILVSYFSWLGIQSSSNKDLLHASLFTLSSRLSLSASQMGSLEMFKQAFNYMEKFSSALQSISNSVHLIKLLSSLSAASSCQELKNKTGEIAINFLKRRWKEETRKANFNDAVTFLLKACFTHSSDVQSTIETFISSAIPEFLRSEEKSETFPTMNKDTFPVYYKMLLHYLNEHIRTITPGTIHSSVDENSEKLLNWNASVKIFRVLINLTKTFDSRNNLTSALKYGRKYVDCFMRQCMPTSDLLLLTHRDDIQAMIKTLQTSTRSLHHLCSHSKIKKDMSLTNQVPQLKCTLENLICRVKDMLNKNSCMGAFWLGNLKNRDLRGEELLSQVVKPPSSDDDDDDDHGDGDGDKHDTKNERAKLKKHKSDEGSGDELMEGSDEGDDTSRNKSLEKEDICYDSDASLSVEF